LYNIYYPENPAEAPIGVVYHKEKFYQFFHSSMTGNPYLREIHKEANNFKLFKDNSFTEAGADDQLTLQIHNSVVMID
jgi:hypothetical protein